jgi:D-alanine-D-alanine ligase-like ATP-grasp enzyme
MMDPHKRVNNKILGLAPQPGNDANLFELFGYDFMIDEDFNVWLIEVNTNPSLTESAHYLS